MSLKYHCLCAALLVALLGLAGCGKKDGDSANANPATVSDERIASVKENLSRGMQAIGFAKVKSSHVGKVFLVEARTPEGGLQMAPPPPPPGMVQSLGQVTFYRGELDSVTAESLTVRKAYPTAGNFKKIEIPRGDIRSIHLAP